MPLTEDGAAVLAAGLEEVQELVDPPAPVWVFDAERLQEVRASLYGWRPGPPRHALVVLHASPADRVGWVCEPFVRARRE